MESRDYFKHPILIFAMVWLALASIAYIAVPEDNEYFWWIAYIFYLGAPTAATIFILNLTKFYGFGSVEGRVWGLLGIGVLLWLIGECLWVYYDLLLGTDPFPTAADYLYILGYAPLMMGLAYKARETVGKISSKRIIAILGAVALASAIIAVWIVIPIMNADDYSSTEKGVNLAYPLLDVVLITFAFAILAAFWDSRTSSAGWVLFSLGIITMTSADILFSAMDWQGIYYAQIDLLWVASYLLFMAGGVYQYMFHKSLMTE